MILARVLSGFAGKKVSGHSKDLHLSDVKENSLDSDYAGENLDRKSTIGGCQFLGRRLISWQCKKQTYVATFFTETEYVAAANCCGQVYGIQNQMLDYGLNFMNTKIYIDNESTICIVNNPVFHSKTKHIAIRHHFIRDAYEKKLIQVLKIHTDDNVADLLTKAFEVSRYITAKVVGKPVSISEASIRSDLLFDDADGIDSLPNQAIFDAIQLMGTDQHETQTNPSPKPLPTSHIPDSIPESSGGNHGGQSSSDKSLSGNEGDMTLKIKKLKKKANPVITYHRAWMKSGRKSAKAEPSIHKDPAFDVLDDDEINHMETEDVQDVGRTRNVVYEEKESDEDAVSTDDALGTDKKKFSTDKEKDSTNKEKDSTDRPDEGTERRSATPTTPIPTPTIFGNDETIAQILLNMSQAKAVSKEKEKGVELKDVKNIERPRPTSTRSLLL
ncbi:hypothetical protein Tco_1144577 [Tanacetum coccineum]